MPDYSKLKWHDGAPKTLRVGMVLKMSVRDVSCTGGLYYRMEHHMVGHLSYKGCVNSEFPDYLYGNKEIKSWAWLEGCER
jgi:hypothetical protein